MNNKIHQKLCETWSFFKFKRNFRGLFLHAAVLATSVVTPTAHAAPIHANATTNDLTTTAAWVENSVPGSTDIAIWDGTNAVGGNLIGTATANIDWGGLQIFNPPGDVTISELSAATFKIEGSGIDMSQAQADLTITNWVNFTVNASQTWNVPDGRILSVPNVIGTFSVGANTLNISGGGLVQLGISNSPTSSGASVNPSISTGGINVQAGSTFAMNASALPNSVNGAGTVVLNGYRPDQSSVSSSANYTTAGTLKLNWASNTRINPASGNWSVGALYISDTNQIFTQGGTTISVTGAGGLVSYFGGVGFDDHDGAAGPPYMGSGFRGLIRNGGTVTINGPVMLLNDGLAPDGVTRLGVLLIGNGSATFNGVIDDGNPGDGGYGIGKPNNANGANITFTAANTYHGDTRWTSGTLTLKNANALQNSTLNLTGGNVTFDSSVSGNIFTFGGLSGSSALSLQNNAGTPAGVTLNVGNNDVGTTFTGDLTGLGGLTKVGNGVLTLTSGTSTYSGSTTISGGTLNINSDANLGTVPGSATPGNLVINGGTLQTATAVGLSPTRGIAFGPASGSGSGTIDVAGQPDSYSGAAANNGAGTGGLNLIDSVGGGSLTLSGANTYTGNTTISNASLILATGGSMASSVSIQAGGTFDVTAFGSYSMTGSSVTGSGTTVAAKIASGGTVDFGSLPVILNFDGSDPALTISAGTLNLNGNSFTINGPVLTPGAYTIITQLAGNISNSGSHSVSGPALAGNIGSISVSGGNVILTVSAGVSFSAFKITGGTSLAAGGSETITVQAVNSSGTTVTGVSGPVSLTFSGLGTSGNGTMPTVGGVNEGTPVSLNFASGSATATLTAAKAESATLQVTDGIHSSTGTGGSGLALTVSGGSAAGLSLVTAPSATATAGTPFATQPVIRIVDAFGNAASSTATVTATASAGTVHGTSSINAVAGVVTFSGLSLTNTGAITLTFASAGLGSTNAAITVSAGAAAMLTIATQPSSSATAGTTFAQQPVISILDAYGNQTSTSGIDVTATPSSGSLSGTPTVASSLGTVSYTDLYLTSGGNVTLTFSASGLASVTSGPISVSGGTATTLVWTTQPVGGASGVPFSTQPVLKTADTYGNVTTNGLAPTLNVSVTLSGSGVLAGTTSYNIGSSGGNGVVNFTDLSVTGSGNFTLSASIIPDPTIAAPSNTIASFASNCILWLDAADTNTLPTSGSQIMEWFDKSPIGNHAVLDPTVTDTTSPVVVTNSALALREPGLSVVNFDGNAFLDVDFTAFYTTANLVATPMTAFCVQVGNNGYMIGTEDSNPFNNNILHLGYKNVGSLVRYGQYGDDLEYPGVFDTTTARSWAWEMTSDTSATPYHQSIFLNGTEVVNYPQRNRYFGESSAGVSVTVGQGHIGRGNNFNYVGDIAEVIVFNTDLSDVDRTNVWNYLNNKWRLGTVGGIATTATFDVGTGSGSSTITSVNVVGTQTTLTFSGTPGNSYTIQRSTNLISGWINLLITNAPPSGVFQYVDTPSPKPDAFYRLKNN